MPLKMSQLEGTAYIDTEWNDEKETTNQVPNSCQISKSQLNMGYAHDLNFFPSWF